MTTPEQTPVLIVGGGPVGLALSLVLDRFGVDHIVIERQLAPSPHPKARGLTARTMETLRVWGLDAAVRAGSLHPEADSDAVELGWIQHYCESVTGRILGVTSPEASIYTPVAKCSVAQDVVEQVLSDSIESNRHSDLRRGCELVSHVEDSTGVLARVRRVIDGSEFDVRARYVIACDGAASAVRESLGLELIGPGTLADMASYYYRADVSHVPHARRTASFLVFPNDPDVPGGTILASDSKAIRWLYLQRLEDPDQALMSEDRFIDVTRTLWGIPDLHVEFISALRWRMRAAVPTSIRVGRVLLAGDAAHNIPPTGGLGLNTGIQDVHNLGWKLALVLRGQAADTLLDTYDLERRPVATQIMEWSVANNERLNVTLPEAIRGRDDNVDLWRAAIRDVENHTHSEGLAMGYVYSSPAVIDDGSPRPRVDARHYWPSDRPGARYPHMWLDADETQSTIDWFDTDLVVVCGPEGERWRAAAAEVAAATGLPIVAHRLPWMAAPINMQRDAAVLVRPDGHVAWRPPAELDDKAGALRAAVFTVLGLAPSDGATDA
jgi:2-polyprenyl-6-methoxyphenol hydroxylase-like FAD-dependent oxidoreductase